MFSELETARLNVENKTRSNLFTWRGQFTPQFVDYLLETYTQPEQIVLDPFCGSGTVLQEATSRNMNAIGLEINPAAYAMARFFSLSGLSGEARKDLVNKARELLQSTLAKFPIDTPLFCESNDYRESIKNLLWLGAQLLKNNQDKHTNLLLLLTLFRAESSKNAGLSIVLDRSFRFLADHLLQLPMTEQVPVAILSDARNSHLHASETVDVIITSPPYINVFNYHQNYRALLELVGFDMLKVAHSEMGSNRKHRGNRFLTVIQYCLDIELTLKSLAKALVPNGLLIMVLGRESRVRGVPFGNSEIVTDLIEHSGAFSRVMSHERVFLNRFGQSIFEDILVARRIGSPSDDESARGIASAMLRRALDHHGSDASSNIEEALSVITSVKPSPFFNKSALI